MQVVVLPPLSHQHLAFEHEVDLILHGLRRPAQRGSIDRVGLQKAVAEGSWHPRTPSDAGGIRRVAWSGSADGPQCRVSGFCSAASPAPTTSSSADTASPRSSPPVPSAIQPVNTGPTIWPAANTMV